MRRQVPYILLCVCILCPLALVAKSSSHSTHHSTSEDSSGKTEHIAGYTTKSGKHVAPYDRHPAGTAPHTSATHANVGTHPADTSSYTGYKKDHVASGYTPHPSVTYDKHGKIKRSTAAKNAFKREHPCPANGHTSGSCPGYVIDHVKPLECGGADAPSNMQWQTVAEGKAKDKTERYCR